MKFESEQDYPLARLSGTFIPQWEERELGDIVIMDDENRSPSKVKALVYLIESGYKSDRTRT